MWFLSLSLYASLCTASLVWWTPGMLPGSDVCSPVASGRHWIANLDRFNTNQPAWQQLQWLRHQAQSITATVWVGDRWSSGILIQRQGDIYTVITNQHVINFGQIFRVTMSDGKQYDATLTHHSGLEGEDLALLQFRSTQVVYPLATLAPSLSLSPGTLVFAGGFPSARDSPQFHFTTGQVSWVSDKVLQGGYQVGYTNPIEKGMSGGPVLNQLGQVVAINGMHAYPLWGNPYIFTDGSRPTKKELKLMQQSSWAIPSERLQKLFPTAFKAKRQG